MGFFFVSSGLYILLALLEKLLNISPVGASTLKRGRTCGILRFSNVQHFPCLKQISNKNVFSVSCESHQGFRTEPLLRIAFRGTKHCESQVCSAIRMHRSNVMKIELVLRIDSHESIPTIRVANRRAI